MGTRAAAEPAGDLRRLDEESRKQSELGNTALGTKAPGSGVFSRLQSFMMELTQLMHCLSVVSVFKTTLLAPNLQS